MLFSPPLLLLLLPLPTKPKSIVIPLKQHTQVNSKNHTGNILQKRNNGGVKTLPLNLIGDTMEDQLYYGIISIGTPPQEIPILFDTGYPAIWVTGSGCSENNNPSRNPFNIELSSTAHRHPHRNHLTLRYPDETIIMTNLYTETISVAGLTVDHQYVGIAFSKLRIMKDAPYDYLPIGNRYKAVFGLISSDQEVFGEPTFLENLYRRGLISHSYVSFFFAREHQGESGSYITFGGIDREMEERLRYYPVSDITSWSIHLHEIKIDQTSFEIGKIAHINTGSTIIKGPLNQVRRLFSDRSIQRAGNNDYQTFNFNCHGALPSISFEFGKPSWFGSFFRGYGYQMSQHDVFGPPLVSNPSLCPSMIHGDRKVNTWTLGIPFLRNVYSVFDFANNRIGLASLESSHSSNEEEWEPYDLMPYTY